MRPACILEEKEFHGSGYVPCALPSQPSKLGRGLGAGNARCLCWATPENSGKVKAAYQQRDVSG